MPTDQSVEVEPPLQPANPRFGPWMAVTKKGNNRFRKENAKVSRQNLTENGMIDNGSRFGPHMNADNLEDNFTSNNTMPMPESQPTRFPDTQAPIPKNNIFQTQKAKSLMILPSGNKKHTLSLKGPTTRTKNALLHAYTHVTRKPCKRLHHVHNKTLAS